MAPLVHTFTLRARFGAEDVFRVLRLVCEHENQRSFEPRFTFDWIARKITISANSREGLATCLDHFLNQIARLGGTPDCLLPGVITESDSRFEQPIGVAIHDAATFGELIGRSLVELRFPGVQVVDTPECCRLHVRKSLMAQQFEYQALVMDFPLPPYITMTDDGMQPLPRYAPPDPPPKKKRKR
ncbi:hypothetical protein HZA57_05465 [Candidatus Poribacteria bacterium]|nr:hypothetical protein [Candidatus Poribacteria bacterium]